MKVTFPKSGKTAQITGLSQDQLFVIKEIIRRVQNDVEWDECSQTYTTTASLLMTMDEDDYKALKSLNF